MNSFIIRKSPRFTLTSWGNGIAYELHRNGDDASASLLFQGDDAAIFYDELTAAEDFAPHEPTGNILRQLWEAYH
jgi:hypothetical protein